MEKLRDFFIDNSQIGAAIITALCGIIGIFINIIINIQFRNRDYINKNRMKQIENMEIYYLPLFEKTRCVIEYIQDITTREDISLYDLLDGNLGADFAAKIRTLKGMISDLYKIYNEGRFKCPDNYRLLKIHISVKRKIYALYHYVEHNIKIIDDIMVNELIQEQTELNYRIRKYEIKLMINVSILKNIEYVKLWLEYKKKLNFYNCWLIYMGDKKNDKTR